MKTNRSGFTLVELLVVITIIGILMGLLIPAVNAARETARRNECSTKLKNLALAAIQHENAKGELPGYLQSYGFFAGGADPTDPTATTTPTRHVKLGTWVVALMPWLDAQPTYEHWTEDRYPVVAGSGGELSGTSGTAGTGFHELAAPNLAIMQCASNPNDESEFARSSYVSNNGFYNGTPLASSAPIVTFLASQDRSNGAFNNKFPGASGAGTAAVGPKVRLDDFKDGQGNTVLFSENVQTMPWNRPGFFNATDLTPTAAAPSQVINYPPQARYTQGMVWHYEDPQASVAGMASSWNTLGTAAAVVPASVDTKHKINGGGTSVSDDIFVLQMTAANAFDIARPSSAHTDGVNAGMADGGTRFITDSIDYRAYQALMTPKGKASVVPWPEYVLDDDSI
ncbi:DUF1559 domain-containing protein [Rhodopirellula sp. SWK7]|uniref:DUF1559 family PulG-like putative transporter n=1 Tax=Rhodopirellula sp. SWK7 TaxID=595460 RepID=UPI0005C5FA6D|nr:DUF1559 domain-containing protein [Rhodopirellula sp. SWK7]